MMKKKWTLEQVLPWLLLVGGLVVVLASIILSVDYINLLKNPHYQPVCNLNPIFSCSSVMSTHQAHAFGIPNEFIGIAGYAALATVGAAWLAGAKFKRWFWRLVEAGVLFAFVFMSWLQFETIYRIGALCLFCMVLWTFTGPIFWYATLYNLRAGHIKLPKKFNRVVAFCQRHHTDILIAWYLLLILLIGQHFWYYWKTII